jgi:hypothetical protein
MKSIINLSRQLSKAKIRHADALAKFLLEGSATHLDSVNEIPLWITTKQLGWTDSTYSITTIQKALVDAKYVERLSSSGQYMNAFRPTKKLLKATFKYKAEIRELAAGHTEKLANHEVRLTQHDEQSIDFANQIAELQAQLAQTRSAMTENQQATQKQIADIWDAIRNIEATNPPVTAEKVEQHLKLVNGGNQPSGDEQAKPNLFVAKKKDNQNW